MSHSSFRPNFLRNGCNHLSKFRQLRRDSLVLALDPIVSGREQGVGFLSSSLTEPGTSRETSEIRDIGLGRATNSVSGTLKGAPDLHTAKPRRCRTVSCAHHLLGLALAAIWRSPQCPLICGTDGIHRIPELGRDSRVRGILYHPHSLAALDLPANFASELKIVALVIDRPRTVGLHQNAIIGRRDELLQVQRSFSRKYADVRHADHGQPIPAFRPQRSTRAIRADRVRR